MSKEIKELKAEINNLKAKVKRLELELDEVYNSGTTIFQLSKEIKVIKQELMAYSNGELYFENSF